MFDYIFPLCHEPLGSLLVKAREEAPERWAEALAKDPNLADKLAGPTFRPFPPRAPRIDVFDACTFYLNMAQRMEDAGDTSCVDALHRAARDLIAGFEAEIEGLAAFGPDGERLLPKNIRPAYESAARLLGKTPVAATVAKA
jgi:hypothetical protein